MTATQSEGTRCPSCGSTRVDAEYAAYPRFGGRDLRVMSRDGDTLHQCRDCELVFVPATPEREATIEKVFGETAYATAALPRHRVVGQEKGENASREAIQAGLFAPFVRAAKPRILDIGCFDGMLLRELGTLLPGASLHGYDVNEATRAIFREDEHRRYHSGALEDVPGPFDLIVFSHSIQYIADIGWLAAQLERLLAKDGTVVVQVPDCASSPFSLFLGDKYYHYTRAGIANVCRRLGLRPEPVAGAAFPRDVIVAATSGQPVGAFESSGYSLAQALQQVDAVCDEVRRERAGGKICVLGTTIASTFVGTVLGGSLGAFADENPEKAGSTHAGHPVIHPGELERDDLIVVPFGPSGAAIAQRFETTYACRCISI